MSHIDDLIDDLCPDGIRQVTLSEVADYSSTRVDAAVLDKSTFVGVDNLVADKGGRVDARYPPNTARLSGYEPGDILLGNIRPYLKKVWRATNKGGCSGDVLAIRIKCENRAELDFDFLYYLLSSDCFFAYNMQHAKGAKMPRGNKAAIMNYRIPIPPLEVQREIVRVLDNFTQLTAELEAELEARRAQYDYYLRDLLSFGAENAQDLCATSVEFVDLGSVVRIRNGSDYKALGAGDVPVYGSGGVMTSVDTPVHNGPSVLIPRKGSLGNLFYVDEPFWTIDTIFYTETDASRLVPKFFYYMMFTQRLAEKNQAGGVPSMTQSYLKRLRIPVPPLEEQRRIVALLDKFDSLVNDLSVGLPAELNARRKQYEHYRDRLLTFKELPA